MQPKAEQIPEEQEPEKIEEEFEEDTDSESDEDEKWAALPRSQHAANTVNPIRKIVDAMSVPPNPDKVPIRLHLGDPTLTGKLLPCPVVTAALLESAASHKHDGYGPSVGELAARQAIVDKYATTNAPFTVDDVILASGASHALQLAIEAIADPGDNILIPNPGFPLYSTLCRPCGIEDRAYQLDMDNGALIDLDSVERAIDERTKAIIVNNPSNPTGAVFPKDHLIELLRIANRHRLTVIADEIYGDLAYDGAEFFPLAQLEPKVPVITCDGIAKRWLVPGWRLGWCIVYNRHGALGDIRAGMVALSQKIVGPCALVQGALPKILRDTPKSFFDNVRNVLSENANIVYESLKELPGLKPVKPYGAMYMMIGIDKSVYGDEKTFVQGLIQEQSVFCLPGSAFSAPGWFRVVLAYPAETTLEACRRIADYCQSHAEVDEMPPMPAILETPRPSVALEDVEVEQQKPVVVEPRAPEEDDDEGVDFDSGTSEDSDERAHSPDKLMQLTELTRSKKHLIMPPPSGEVY